MNRRSKKSIPRAGSPAGTAIWSIGLLNEAAGAAGDGLGAGSEGGMGGGFEVQ